MGQSLERYTQWIGLCLFGQTGIGWPGPHHCLFCWLYTRIADLNLENDTTWPDALR